MTFDEHFICKIWKTTNKDVEANVIPPYTVYSLKKREQILSFSRQRQMEWAITTNFHDIFYDLKKPTNIE